MNVWPCTACQNIHGSVAMLIQSKTLLLARNISFTSLLVTQFLRCLCVICMYLYMIFEPCLVWILFLVSILFHLSLHFSSTRSHSFFYVVSSIVRLKTGTHSLGVLCFSFLTFLIEATSSSWDENGVIPVAYYFQTWL